MVVGEDGGGGEGESHRVLWVVARIDGTFASAALTSWLHLHVVVVGGVTARVGPLSISTLTLVNSL